MMKMMKICALFLAFAISAAGFSQTAADLKPEINFRYPVGGALARSPFTQGETVYLLSEDRAVYALNDSGKILYRWQAPNKTGVLHPALYGLVFFVPGDGTVIALNRVGREAFRLEVSPNMVLPPVLTKSGRIYAVSGEIVCFGLSGLKKWSVPLPARATAGPIADQSGIVSTLCEDGSLVLVSEYGEVTATIKTGIGSDTLSGQNGLLAVGSGNKVSLYRVRDGSLSRVITLPGKVKRLSPAESGIDFAVLTSDSSIHGISVLSGLVWTVPIRTEMAEDLVCRSDRIYAVSNHLVTSIDSKGGVWRELGIRNPGTLPAVSEGGTVYSGGLDWILYSYRFENRPVAEPWDSDEFRKNPPLPALLGLDFRLETSEGQKELLFEVEKFLKTGTIGVREEEAFAVCSYVLKTVKDANAAGGKPLSQYDPTVRIQAAEILAGLAGLEMRPVLISSFREDPDLAVKAACADALGVIGYDGDGKTAAAFDDIMSGVSRKPDERLAVAIASAIEKMYRFEGAPANPRAIHALFKVADGPWPEPVRKRALDIMMRISRGTY